MGATIGEPIKDVGRPSGEAPSIGAIQAAPYPPNSRGDGAVLLEVELTSAGKVKDVKVLRSGGGFDEPRDRRGPAMAVHTAQGRRDLHGTTRM